LPSLLSPSWKVSFSHRYRLKTRLLNKRSVYEAVHSNSGKHDHKNEALRGRRAVERLRIAAREGSRPFARAIIRCPGRYGPTIPGKAAYLVGLICEQLQGLPWE
jgi:hypothetical protein